jgi:sugar/nucleoside kinase (ribokinase family)
MWSEMTEADQISSFRDEVSKYFRDRGRTEGVDVRPVIRDERTTNLAERLYEENRADRAFIVYPALAGGGDLDPFVKKTGIDYDIALLGVFAPLDKSHFPKLWEMYVEWLHKRVDADSVLRPGGDASG